MVSDSATRRATLNRLLFAGPTRDFLYGLTTEHEHVISLGKGVRLLVTLQAVSEPDEKGMRTVMVTLNGQPRTVEVRDTSVASEVPETEKADPSDPGHVAAPFAGAVTVTVAEGDVVEPGGQVATIEAMKMEASITTPVAGTVRRLAIGKVQQVEGGDLVVEVGAG